jgi:guanyl-specific ribonuclease Sa
MTDFQLARRLSLNAAFFVAITTAPSLFGQASGSPAVLDTKTPIIVKSSKPKATKLSKFEGYVQNANNAQITLRAKDNETSIQTFSLTQEASEKMQQIMDVGGYQYGDKVIVFYDPATRKAIKFKGKPSRPI